MRKQNVGIAIMARAPVPGLTKTRLIPSIGAHAAAVLQERLTERTVATALAAAIGPVTLWCAPGPSHASFRDPVGRGAATGPVTLWGAPDPSHAWFRHLVVRLRVTLKQQAEGDLGARMLAAMA